MRLSLETDDPLTIAIAPPPDESPEQRALRIIKEAEARRVSDEIDEGIKEERAARKKEKNAVVKILLLGQSESGKSTTLKNLQMMYTPKAWLTERDSWRAVIHLNLVRSVNTILDALAAEFSYSSPSHPYSTPSSPAPSSPISDPEELDGHDDIFLPPVQLTNRHTLLRLRLTPLRRIEADLKKRLGAATDDVTDTSLSDADASMMMATPFDKNPYPPSGRPTRRPRGEFCVRSHSDLKHAMERPASPQGGDDVMEVLLGCKEDMQELWRDDVVQEILRRRDVNLPDWAVYFLDEIKRIVSRDYELSDKDVLRARLRTLGVQEYRLKFEPGTEARDDVGKSWLIYDVGGSRTTRAAWLPFFEDAHAVIFLAPISCFDERLAEDRRINRLEDSFILWSAIVSAKLLEKCMIILFLNKYDLLDKKLKSGVQVNKHMTSYGDRENRASSVAKYLRTKFREQLKENSPRPRNFYGFLTTAIDQQATASTLASVRDGILRLHLKQAEFV